MRASILSIILLVAACSSKSSGRPPSSTVGGGASPSGARGDDEEFLTRVYTPPAQPEVNCAGGVPATLAPEWHSMKVDDRVSPANVYVHLDGPPHTCTVGIGQFPRSCKHTDGWNTTCTNRDGTRPHVGQIRCIPNALEIWVVAPEGEFRIAELPRPVGAAPCRNASSSP